MYYYLTRDILKNYFIQVFITAVLAYSLFFLLIIDWHQPRGFEGYLQSYFYGFFFFFPLWLVAFLIAGKFAKGDLKYYRIILLFTAITLSFLFIAPLLFHNDSFFDSILPLFYVMDFLACLSLFKIMRAKILVS